jgi:hypothetical protein
MSGIQYSLTFQNNSTNFGSVCVYQTDPRLGPDVMSLAWFAKPTHPTTSETFRWSLNYGFIWSETQTLAPGIIVNASQVWEADLTQKNKVTFLKERNAYTFRNLTRGERPGVLQIEEGDELPASQAKVGISMSGAGIFVKQAQPNVTLFFEPSPEYWITFGNYVPGQVLSVTEIVNKKKIEFGHDVFSAVATLKADNTWSIS